MPKTSASNIPHMAQTDHRIRIVRSTPTLTPTQQAAEISVAPFERDLFPVAPNTETRALAISLASQALTRNSQKDAKSAIEMLRPTISDKDAAVLLAAAKCMIVFGKLDDATTLIQRRDSPDEAAIELMTHIAIQQRESQKALAFIDTGLKLNPRNPHALRQKTGLLLQMNQPTLAVETAERLLEIDPLNEPARQGLIELYKSQEKHEQAAYHRQILNAIR